MKMAALIITRLVLFAFRSTERAGPKHGTSLPGNDAGIAKFLDGDLVSFDLEMTRARHDLDAWTFDKWFVAKVALILFTDFVRSVRNDVKIKCSVWNGMEIRTLSESQQSGVVSIDARVGTVGCGANNFLTI
ncbi:MAG: hypothetical protein P8O69_04470 [Amylibacter sp.]|nr:hypothetical protein [Amylibacter sp.]